MSSPISEIDWSQPILPEAPDPAWNEEVRRRFGGVAKIHDYVARLGWLRQLVMDSWRITYPNLPPRLMGLASLVTSHENACRYCTGTAHAQMRLLGFDEELLRKIERDADLAGVAPAERALLAFCRNLARSSPRPARAESEALEKLGYDRRLIVEVASLVAFTCLSNRVATFIAVPVEDKMEAMPDKLMTKLFRPLLSWMMSRSVKPLELRPGHPPADRAFAGLLSLVGNSTIAVVVGDAIDGALASPVLPRRTKAWMFAVVATSIGCTLCADESRRILRAEGVGDAVIDSTLATLASTALDPTEALLLPWVRETVRYRTPTMQRKTRELARLLPPDQLLEAIGVAGMANAFGRLGMLAQ